jgi:hypothetical protein
LGDYEQVRRIIAGSLADVFLIESVSEWVMLAERAGRNPLFEQIVAKNVASLACWRVVERTMSLLASEGFETASSKSARGAVATPLEQLFRDARGLRISGGVDFQLDYWVGKNLVFATYYSDRPADRAVLTPDPVPDSGKLSDANTAHLRFLHERVRRFGEVCAGIAQRYPDPGTLFAKQRLNTVIGGIGSELLAMSLVLARCTRIAEEGGDPLAGEVVDIYCTEARRRLADADGELSDVDVAGTSGHDKVGAAWLSGEAVWRSV